MGEKNKKEKKERLRPCNKCKWSLEGRRLWLDMLEGSHSRGTIAQTVNSLVSSSATKQGGVEGLLARSVILKTLKVYPTSLVIYTQYAAGGLYKETQLV